MTDSTWARALAVLRVESGLTQKELARLSGVNKATISSYERGRQQIGGENLQKLLRAMDLPIRAWATAIESVEEIDWLRSWSREEEEGLCQQTALFRRVGEQLARSAGRNEEGRIRSVFDRYLGILKVGGFFDQGDSP